MPDASRESSLRAAGVALVVDVALVLLFATIGRFSHEEGLTVSGVLGVAWPFVVAHVLLDVGAGVGFILFRDRLPGF